MCVFPYWIFYFYDSFFFSQDLSRGLRGVRGGDGEVPQLSPHVQTASRTEVKDKTYTRVISQVSQQVENLVRNTKRSKIYVKTKCTLVSYHRSVEKLASESGRQQKDGKSGSQSASEVRQFGSQLGKTNIKKKIFQWSDH